MGRAIDEMMRWRSALVAAWIAIAPAAAHAQVVLDGTLRPAQSGVTVPSGSDAAGRPATYLIDEAQGQRAGANVFHSFSRFDVPSGETATFDRPHAGDPGAQAVQHVVARVTEANPSKIAGTLRSTYIDADVLLINPAGVTFDEGARIDVPASLRISTADYVKLGSDGRFDAADPSRDALSMAPPSAFGFLGAPAGVTVEPGARVRFGEPSDTARGTLAIVAGDVHVAGSLNAYRGGLDLVSVRSAGEADLTHLDASAANFAAMGDVRVTGKVLNQRAVGDSAELRIRAGRFEIDGGSVVERVLSKEAETGRIDVAATDVVLVNGGQLDARNTESGHTPRIEIDATRVSIGASNGERGSRIDGSASGISRGSDVRLRASESVTIRPGSERGGIFADANGTGPGDGGSITIETPLLVLGELGRISSGTDDVGDAGRIDLHIGDLEGTGGAQIRTDVGPDGRGRAGDITVEASGTVRFAERVALFPGPPYQRPSGISADTGDDEGGARVRVSAAHLVLDNAEIRAATRGSGDAADIDIDVDTLEIRHGGRIFTGTDGLGHGGEITVHARERVLIAGPTGPLAPASTAIQATTTGPGDAGRIAITTPRLQLAATGRISAFSAENPRDDPDGRINPSDIPGAGGEISLSVGDLIVEDDGIVEARTAWAGPAGSISVHASGSVSIHDAKPMLGLDPRDAGFQTRTFSSGDAGTIFLETPLLRIDGGAIETSAVQIENLFTPHVGDAGDVVLHVSRLEIGGWGRVRSAAEEGGNAGHIRVSASDSVSIQGDGAFGVVAGISTDTLKTGAGGAIDVDAPRIRVAGVGEIAARTSGSEDGGTIRLQGSDIEIGPAGIVTAASTGSGDAGDVSVTGRSLLVDGGRVATSAATADGGNVVLTLADALRMRDAEITGSVLQGVGGNITIDSELVVLENSQILAQAAEGRGGAIRIVATFVFATDSLVSASAGPTGVDGVVEIVSPDADLSANLELPPAIFLDAATLLRERCAARAGARASLYVVEAPAAATSLDGWLASPIAAEREHPTTTAARPVVVLSCSG